MKILTLNIAHGQQFSSLIPFIQKQASKTDIFCFQEVFFGHEAKFTEAQHARLNIYDELSKVLTDFNPYTYKAPVTARYFYHELLPNGIQGGLATFVNKKIKVKDKGGFRCYKSDNFPGFDFGAKLTGNCQWIEVSGLTIMNLHGIYQRDTNKLDTKARFQQAQIIKKFINSRVTKVILCGDFNLLPNNRSLVLLEENMINLIKKYRIKSTRSDFYTGKHKYADYVLTTPNIKINRFKIINKQVSDHLPMVVEIEL